MSAGQLALHLARIPGGAVRLAEQNQVQAPDFTSEPQPSSLREILNAFEESISTGKLLTQFDGSRMQETWRIVAGEGEVLAIPRAQFLRDIMLNHWYQHRGQFSVYLRLLNVAVPSSWGPSADEMPPFLQRTPTA